MTPQELNTYSVYMHTNKKNKMKYIGITNKLDVKERWGNNGRGYSRGQNKFYNAIKEFGWENFNHKIIKSNMSKNEALDLEELLITKYNTVCNGYNSSPTGKHNYLSDEGKEKLRQQRIGANNPNYNPNIKHKYTKSRNPIIQKENKLKYYTFPENEETTDGRKSIEFSNRQKELKTGKNNPNFGKHPWCYGIKMTPEQTQKMKDAYTDERRELVRQRHLGNKNPQAKKVICITKNKIYDTIVEAAKDNNVSERSVSQCCNHRMKSVRGLVFVFQKEVIDSDPS